MLLEIHPANPDERKIRKVVDCVNAVGVVVFPTDTVYAIGASLMKPKAIEQMAKIKGVRAEKANFSLICYDLSSLSEFATVDTPVFKVMKKALPGPYTFILNANNKISRYFGYTKRTVGIRVPDNNIIRTIVRDLGHPIITTSVHDDDEILDYTTDPSVIHERYEKQVAIVIDGGYGHNEASTVIDCTEGYPQVIREGIGPTENLI